MLKSLIETHDGATHLDKQRQLIESAISEDRDLSDALEYEGWSYDDLIYERSNALSWRGRMTPKLDELLHPGKGIPFVSFFTGCGGMDLGLEAAGFQHVAAFEINELFCNTLRHNRPIWKVFGPPIHSGDVSNIDDTSSALSTVIKTPFEGLFVGGPPCQPFSIAANQRFARWGDNFKRTGFLHATNGNLLFDFIELVITFRPKAFVIENVPGLRDLDGGEQLASAIGKMKSAGYEVHEPFVLDASNHGVPQQRLRLFVVGSRDGGSLKLPKAQESIGAGSVLSKRIAKRTKNSETRQHKAESILRYMKLDYGSRDQLGRVDRLNPALPSKTVIAGGTNGGGRSHLHPEIPRTLSVRECARLQTFPDEYEFIGATARQFTQVGNAVPPVLAATLGHMITEGLF